jgi:hypothetical protein
MNGIIERIEKDDERCQQATPGPWVVGSKHICAPSVGESVHFVNDGEDYSLWCSDEECVAMHKNSEFVAYARGALEASVSDRRLLVKAVKILMSECRHHACDVGVEECLLGNVGVCSIETCPILRRGGLFNACD